LPLQDADVAFRNRPDIADYEPDLSKYPPELQTIAAQKLKGGD